MDIQELRQKLVKECLNYGAYQGTTEVVVDIPYIPYIPENWNGILVVAEAQNLNIGDYANCSDEQKICRLYPDHDSSRSYAIEGPFPKMDVNPWADGSMPLALKAALNINPYEIAICNACLWSRREGNANANPNEEMQTQSGKLWEEMWPLLDSDTEKVICCGSIAASIFDFAGEKLKELRHPSPNAMSRISGMFKIDDLLNRYPEVETAYQELRTDDILETCKQNKVFFACHAVSLLKNNTERNE